MDAERTANVRQRVANLNPNSPFSSWKSALEAMIDAVRSESLETGIAEEEGARQERRMKINELKQQLLEELKDPQAMYIRWFEWKDEPERN